jgi:hypothetical protein
MALRDEIDAMTTPARECRIGQVVSIEEHPAWGWSVVVVERPGRRRYTCRPAFLGRGPDRGDRFLPVVDDEVLFILPGGAPERAILLPYTLSSRATESAEGWGGTGRRISVGAGRLEVSHTDEASNMSAVVVEPFLDGLLGPLDAIFAWTLPTPGAAAAGAYKTEIDQFTTALTALKTAVTTFRTAVRTSLNPSAAGPYLSSALAASVEDTNPVDEPA